MYGCHLKKISEFGWVIFLLLLVTTPAIAVGEKEQSDLTSYKEISQIRLDNARELLQKDIQSLSLRLDAQDKRLDAQNSHIDQSLSILGSLLSYLGIVLALAGLAGYVSVQSKAKKEAQKEAKATTNEWFERSSADVQVRLNNLQSKLDLLESQAETNFSSHMQQLIDKQALADLAMNNIQQSIVEAQSFFKSIPEVEAQALSEAAQATKNKPESQYTYIDWNYRAFDALRKGDKESAVQYWRASASSIPVAPDVKSQALYNAGATLALLNRHDDAISMFDEVVKSFWDSSNPFLERQVAQALNGKIVSLGMQKRYAEALASIDIFLKRFEQSQQDELQVQIRTALYHKGVTYQEMSRIDECLETFDEIVERFESSEYQQGKEWAVAAQTSKGLTLLKVGRDEEANVILDDVISRCADDQSDAIRNQVGKAMNSKGYSLLCQAKEAWSNSELRSELLEHASSFFTQGLIKYPGNAFILGNLAYSGHLLNRSTVEVEGYLTEALNIGGENLYNETINDINTHPIGDRDDEFRTLLDKCWNAINNDANVQPSL
jgi:hypothetical protein